MSITCEGRGQEREATNPVLGKVLGTFSTLKTIVARDGSSVAAAFFLPGQLGVAPQLRPGRH
jgi:hypothetical protein